MKRGCVRSFLIALASLAGLCILLAALSGVINAMQPTRSAITDRLSEVEKARLAEAVHLRQALGDQVLPGWGQADIPIIVYNEEILFLVGAQNPTDGWRKVPQGTQIGAAWSPLGDDDFFGVPYYFQKYPAPGVSSQGFTVQVGDQWVASLATYEWARILMINEVTGDLPKPLQRIFPATLMRDLLLPGSDSYATLILHEAVHAYQGIRDPDRLNGAEIAARETGKRYPWHDPQHRQAWQKELDILHSAMQAETQEETVRLAREFLANRTERREAAGLSEEMIALERLKEWEEGIAKYGERTIYLLALEDESYQPLPEVTQDKAFHGYKSARQKWDQEVDQMRRMADTEGDGRFYYTGFAQAVLLDRLSPGWKDRLFEEGVWLEDLLTEAVAP